MCGKLGAYLISTASHAVMENAWTVSVHMSFTNKGLAVSNCSLFLGSFKNQPRNLLSRSVCSGGTEVSHQSRTGVKPSQSLYSFESTSTFSPSATSCLTSTFRYSGSLSCTPIFRAALSPLSLRTRPSCMQRLLPLSGPYEVGHGVSRYLKRGGWLGNEIRSTSVVCA